MGKEQGLQHCVVGIPCPPSLLFLPAFCSTPGKKEPPEIPGRKMGSAEGVTQGGKRCSPSDELLSKVPTELGPCPVSPA